MVEDIEPILLRICKLFLSFPLEVQNAHNFSNRNKIKSRKS